MLPQQAISLPTQILSIPTPLSFFSLGDSYSAGIGADCGWITDAFDPNLECFRCIGAFPYQFANLTGNNDTEVFHIACTGSSTRDMTHSSDTNRTSQLELMRSVASDAGLGTLTIGGNDVGFGSIVANCIAFDRPSCDGDLNFTEAAIADKKILSTIAKTYLAVLDTATAPNFTLVVPGYAQFFNAETKECDVQYLLYGRYLTRSFRARVNEMVVRLNLVIQMAVAMVQLHLVFRNSPKSIYYEDWDGLFDGHRFCEPLPKTWVDSWFFTIRGADTLPNGTVFTSDYEGPEYLKRSKRLKCNRDIGQDLGIQIACNMALRDGVAGTGDVYVEAYPWWAMKVMHPKTIGHHALAVVIFDKWTNGEYFLGMNS